MKTCDGESIKAPALLKEAVSSLLHSDGRRSLNLWAKDNFDRIFSDQLTDADIFDIVAAGDWQLADELADIASIRKSERYDSFCLRLSQSLRCTDGGFELVPFQDSEESNTVNGSDKDACLADSVAYEHGGDCSRVGMCVFHLLTAYMQTSTEKFFELLANIPQCDVMYSLVHSFVSMALQIDAASEGGHVWMVQIPREGSLVPFVMLFKVLFHENTQSKEGDVKGEEILSLLRHLIDSCEHSDRKEYAIVMAAWLIRVSRGRAVFNQAFSDDTLQDGMARSVLRMLEGKIQGWKCAANDRRFLMAFGIDNWIEDLSIEAFRKTGLHGFSKLNLQLYLITLTSLGLEASDADKRGFLLGALLSSGICGYWNPEKFSILGICMANLLSSCDKPIEIYEYLASWGDQAFTRLRFAHSDQHSFTIEDKFGLLIETGICALEAFLNHVKYDVCEKIFEVAWGLSVNLLYVSILPKSIVDYVRYLFVYRVKLAVAQNVKVELLELLKKLPRPVLSADRVDDCYSGCLESVKLNFTDLKVILDVDEKLYRALCEHDGDVVENGIPDLSTK